MKNFLIRVFLKCLRPFFPKHPVDKRFLIVTTTALGDTLWATPAIESLRRSFPSAYIAVLTSPIGLETLKHNPHIDRLFLFKNPLRLIWPLYRERFDTVLLFHASQRLALPLCSLVGATRIVGTAEINKGLDTLLTDPLPNIQQHAIVRRLKIIEQIGAQVHTQTLSFFPLPEEQLPPRSPGPWIALHPGSKDSFRRWPAASFIALGKLLKKTLPCEILVTGTEHSLIEEIASQIPGAHIDPPRPLRQFAALLQQMDLLVTNDTGPVHLACALNRPVIAIYAASDPALFGPHHAKLATAISRRPTCTPCLKRRCREPFCFLQIGPAEVAEAAKKYLIEKPEQCKAALHS